MAKARKMSAALGAVAAPDLDRRITWAACTSCRTDARSKHPRAMIIAYASPVAEAIVSEVTVESKPLGDCR